MTTTNEMKWAEAMDCARKALELARAAERDGDWAQARLCANVAHRYHEEARQYEE